MDANYCIDKNRVFGIGFSYGGMMPNTVACYLGDLFRAMAPLAGSDRGWMALRRAPAWAM